ncbi:spore germination protein [Paenibacillus montanisoli]|uniref:Spore germination protein n=1 Tax=Paenibacillus montanisoli TaxID=2081970 RepID=A0A328U2L8_9BACL|nr:spore germination protein [Paenibacillus montanisoli]RAP76023.1 spore germination protein [Paenibacillus montanisoli]
MNVGKSVKENELLFRNLFQHCSDIQFRELTINGGTKLLLIYVDGMIDTDVMTTNVLKPLLYDGLPQGLGTIDSIAQMCDLGLFAVMQSEKLTDCSEIEDRIMKGNAAILADGEDCAVLLNCTKFETRGIEESSNEAALRGSRESFTELLRTNTTMLRRIVSTSNLKMESVEVGRLTKTEVVISYIEGIAPANVVNEIRSRIHRIRLDAVLESSYIEESIEDTHYSPFPQMVITERPDIVSAGLMKGKVAVLTNGTPNVILAPMTFWVGLQAPDDFYERFLFASMNRWIRYIFSVFSILFPSIYIALTNYHPEMVPPKLMLSITGLREASPFPTIIEIFLMEFMFEALREAGIRLPKQIGPLVSIVGALVIGEAAVRAGIISAPIVIVVSAAGISSFVIPMYRFSFPFRMLRFPLLILSGLFGLFGIALGIIAILIHLIGLTPFGTPYLTPVTPIDLGKIKNILLRWPRKLVSANPSENGADRT